MYNHLCYVGNTKRTRNRPYLWLLLQRESARKTRFLMGTVVLQGLSLQRVHPKWKKGYWSWTSQYFLWGQFVSYKKGIPPRCQWKRWPPERLHDLLPVRITVTWLGWMTPVLFLYFFFHPLVSSYTFLVTQILFALPSLTSMAGLIKLNKVSDSNAVLPGRVPKC